MSERVYDRLANVFMLVAVGSALLFNSASSWHWVVGAFGVVAGAAAVVLYFTNQSRNQGTPDSAEVAEKSETAARQAPLTLSENWTVGVDLEGYALRREYLLESPKALRFYTQRNLGQHAARNRHLAYWCSYEEAALTQQELSLSPNEIAACAIEIIRNLSSGEDRDQWEFNFGPKGLRVMPARYIKSRNSIEERSTIGRPEFESGQISEMVN